MKNPWIFPAAALAIGALGGFLAGKNTSPADAAAKEEASGPRTRSQNRPETASNDSKRSGTRARSTDEIYRAPGQNNRIQALMDYYAGLTPEQLEAEAAKLEDLPMSERMVASVLLFGRWAETDPIAAMAYTGKMGFTGNFVRPTVLQSWASIDPAGAAKYYGENARDFMGMGMMGGGRGPMGGGSGASTIAGEWARQDPAAAMAWANSLTGPDKASAMGSVIREVANGDPAKAWGMVAPMDQDSQTRAYEDIAAKWASKSFPDAEAMIRALPADQQNAAMASAISSLSKSDPKLAAAKAAAMPEGDDRNEAISTVARNWSRDNPKEAATWAMTQGDDEAKGDAIGEIMPNWVTQDEKGALAFLNGQEAGAVRDSAASAYVMNNRTGNSAEVLKVAESITEKDARERAVRVSAIRLMTEDPVAGNTYIQGSDLFSDEMKTRAAEGKPLWGGTRAGGGPGGRGGRGGN
jgi:hypothetical protein